MGLSEVDMQNQEHLEQITAQESLSVEENIQLLRGLGFRVTSRKVPSQLTLYSNVLNLPEFSVPMMQGYPPQVDPEHLQEIGKRLGMGDPVKVQAVVYGLGHQTEIVEKARLIEEPWNQKFFDQLGGIKHLEGEEYMEACKKIDIEAEQARTPLIRLVEKISWDNLFYEHTVAPINVAVFFNRPDIAKAWGPQNVLQGFWPHYQFQDAVGPKLAELVAAELYNGDGPDDSLILEGRGSQVGATLGAYHFYNPDIARAFVEFGLKKLKAHVECDPTQDNPATDAVGAVYLEELMVISQKYPGLSRSISEGLSSITRGH